MVYKFAHMADVHLGAFRDPLLRELNFRAFSDAIDICIKERVDFIIIGGDLFDSNVPDTSIAERAARKLREAKEHGIRIYVIYGSHDYSPTKASMIDVLHGAGLFTNVSKIRKEGEKSYLEFAVDEKTGAKITGISARKMGIESKVYETLVREPLEKEDGFKIFVFHSAIEGALPKELSFLDAVPLSWLPKGFAYYAGGHVHFRIVKEVNTLGFFGDNRAEGSLLAFPGALFGYDYRDLEATARGERRGFFIAEFDGSKITSHKFVELKPAEILLLEYDATGEASFRVNEELFEMAERAEVNNKIVLFKVYGELASGKVSEIEFAKLRDKLLEKRAMSVYINKNSLRGREVETKIQRHYDTREEIERAVLKEMLGKLKLENERLAGSRGVELALRLMNVLKQENAGETKAEYEERIVKEALRVLGLEREGEETATEASTKEASPVAREETPFGQISLRKFWGGER